MTAPTKADPLYERMLHAFGDKRINDAFKDLVWKSGLIDLLTDEARDELVRRCISNHKLSRKFAAESRRHYRKKQNAF